MPVLVLTRSRLGGTDLEGRPWQLASSALLLLARVSYIYVACRTVQSADRRFHLWWGYPLQYLLFKVTLLQLLDAPRHLPRNRSGNILLHAECSCCKHFVSLDRWQLCICKDIGGNYCKLNQWAAWCSSSTRGHAWHDGTDRLLTTHAMSQASYSKNSHIHIHTTCRVLFLTRLQRWSMQQIMISFERTFCWLGCKENKCMLQAQVTGIYLEM